MRRLILFGAGLSLILAAFIFLRVFSPIISQEISYRLHKPNLNQQIKPVSLDFSVVIPKINANARIVPGVNPANSAEYQRALSQGVAAAAGSSFPGENGQIFLFAHSAGSPLEANRFNGVFYLLNKLEKNDEIFIYYQKKKYVYAVREKKIVSPQEVSYLNPDVKGENLALMTCWPPGTTINRLLIFARLKKLL